MPLTGAAAIGQEMASVPFDEMIRNLLLAMVDAQNVANMAFVQGVKELADDNLKIQISYKKSNGNQTTVEGTPIAFGILPTMLQIQQGVIEIKMVITMQRTQEFAISGNLKIQWKFFSLSVDAKYSNTYSYKVEASSYIRIQVAPTPPPEPLMEVIKQIMQEQKPGPPSGGSGG
jgi:hypothetical protein